MEPSRERGATSARPSGRSFASRLTADQVAVNYILKKRGESGSIASKIDYDVPIVCYITDDKQSGTMHRIAALQFQLAAQPLPCVGDGCIGLGRHARKEMEHVLLAGADLQRDVKAGRRRQRKKPAAVVE